ncbi:hypothetical protein IEE94_07340 [Yimella sp. cx-573]|nr:hypothetical protein [Yimella sp. cx-573]
MLEELVGALVDEEFCLVEDGDEVLLDVEVDVLEAEVVELCSFTVVPPEPQAVSVITTAADMVSAWARLGMEISPVVERLTRERPRVGGFLGRVNPRSERASTLTMSSP